MRYGACGRNTECYEIKTKLMSAVISSLLYNIRVDVNVNLRQG